MLENPGKAFKKSKFIKNAVNNKLELNKELIAKTELLEGIKAYATNVSNIAPELLISKL
ncbi:hypothetical protein HZC34_05935 [Candidatus Saganbacteria bacterium]|nr:hypothetical protein [Candidatus Saganbacteria bacterium]